MGNNNTTIIVDKKYSNLLNLIIQKEKNSLNKRFNNKKEFLEWSIRTAISEIDDEEFKQKIMEAWKNE